jgi:hypothetical protein
MSERRRILVLANETCAGTAVCEEVRYRAGRGEAEVLVVAPTLNESRLGHWLSSHSESAREDAQQRLSSSVAALSSAGLDAKGELGDSDPLQALDDAIRVFRPDEVIISTHPPSRSNWLERRVVQRARERYAVPITHLVVDLIHEAALTHDDPRPAPRQPKRMLTLYHLAGYEEALAVQTHGFENVRNTVAGRSGVVFTDTQTEYANVHDPTVFVVDVPEELAVAYEVPEEGGVRRFVLPAELVNRHVPRALATDWSE